MKRRKGLAAMSPAKRKAIASLGGKAKAEKERPKFSLVHRENGLIELACHKHGVGHPSSLLTPPQFYYAIHGCCGCCSLAAFALAELEFVKEGLNVGSSH